MTMILRQFHITGDQNKWLKKNSENITHAEHIRRALDKYIDMQNSQRVSGSLSQKGETN